MTARIHPGALIHYWDHFVITLRHDDGAETLLSLYAIVWSASLGPGHVAFLRGFGPTGEVRSTAWSDDAGLGARMQARLRDMGGTGAELTNPVTPATFERHPFRAGGLGFTIRAADETITARWEAAGQPFWVEGPAPDFSPTEDIWSCFVEAHDAVIEVDGRRIPGAPFLDPVWTPKLGRSLSSAHVALAEVRVTPHPGREPG